MDLIERLRAFHRDREPERLARKYALMNEDAFAFLRGTNFLFHEDLDAATLPPTPAGWICGDLHLENLGTFRGDNRLVYFDLNDFGDACLAPVSWEVTRLLTSLYVAGAINRLAGRDLDELAGLFLNRYGAALAAGKARWIERATADGVVGDLILRLKRRTQGKLLDKRTEWSAAGGSRGGGRKKRRRLRMDPAKTLRLLPGQPELLEKLFAQLVDEEGSGFFRLLDVARRVAGLGSLGHERWVALVEGDGSPEGNRLIDLKYEPGSVVARCSPATQPKWKSEAHRVATVQGYMQAVSPALLRAVKAGGRHFKLSELAPTDDRVDLAGLKGKPARWSSYLATVAEASAWSQLRAAGRFGSARVEEFEAFGANRKWHSRAIEVARSYARRVKSDWATFSAALADGALD